LFVTANMRNVAGVN